MQAVHSFDVFDTALTRTWAKPIDLFWELGVQLRAAQLIQLSPEAWQRLRIEAESHARRKTTTNEITIQAIYHELADVLGWSQAQAELALQSEIQLERNSLRPISTTKQHIQTLRQKGHSITFLSDMYLPSEVIRAVLMEHQIMSDEDTLYVSGDVGCNKASGKLFQHYLSGHQLSPNQLKHTGDNLSADVEVPKRLGIQTHFFTAAHLNRYEQMISEDAKLPLKFRSLLAGASRLTRLQCQASESHHRTIWNTSANVIAPVLFGFVYWCLLEAQRRGIQRLYFVARDGQILCKIAQIICQNWHYPVDCRYFYGSRQAFHFPTIQQIGDTEIEWMFAANEFLSVHDVCKRVNLDPTQIAPTLVQFGFPQETWEQNLSPQRKAALKQVFQAKDVVELVVANATIYREKALGYFRQEGLADGIPFATVDVGWTGSSQRSLSKLLTAGNMYPEAGTIGFYFGLTATKKAFSTDKLIPYFLKPEPPSEQIFLTPPEIIELFMAADHGSTVRYEQQTDQFVPVLRHEKNEKGLKWGLETQHRAILEYANQITSVLQPADCPIDYFEYLTEKLLSTFIFNPDPTEAPVFGSLTFAQEQSESKFDELAPAFTFAEALRALVNPKTVHNFVWFPAAIQRSSKWAKAPLSRLMAVRQSERWLLLAWRALLQQDQSNARIFWRKALAEHPALWLNQNALYLGALLLTQKFFSPTRYQGLRSFYKTLTGQKKLAG